MTAQHLHALWLAGGPGSLPCPPRVPTVRLAVVDCHVRGSVTSMVADGQTLNLPPLCVARCHRSHVANDRKLGSHVCTCETRDTCSFGRLCVHKLPLAGPPSAGPTLYGTVLCVGPADPHWIGL